MAKGLREVDFFFLGTELHSFVSKGEFLFLIGVAYL